MHGGHAGPFGFWLAGRPCICDRRGASCCGQQLATISQRRGPASVSGRSSAAATGLGALPASSVCDRSEGSLLTAPLPGPRLVMAAANGAVGGPEAVAAKLLDFSQPLDVALLDSTVNAFYGAGSNQEVREDVGPLQCFRAGRSCACSLPSLHKTMVVFSWAKKRCWYVQASGNASTSCPAAVPACPAHAGRLASLLQRTAAEAVLKAVQEHPEAWTRVDAILEHSKNQQTKFFGLQVGSLSRLAATRWWGARQGLAGLAWHIMQRAWHAVCIGMQPACSWVLVVSAAGATRRIALLCDLCCLQRWRAGKRVHSRCPLGRCSVFHTVAPPWLRLGGAFCLPTPPRCTGCTGQVLESVVRTRWGALPDAQREGIKTYCSNLIIKISTDEKAFRTERTFLNKLNLVCGSTGASPPPPACVCCRSPRFCRYRARGGFVGHGRAPGLAVATAKRGGGPVPAAWPRWPLALCAGAAVVHVERARSAARARRVGGLAPCRSYGNRRPAGSPTCSLARHAACAAPAGFGRHPQAGLAPQVAVVHPRHRGRLQDERDAVRELHGHPAPAVGGGV